MKKTIQSLLLAILFVGLFAFNNANAQVVVAGSGGAANGSYATLKLAFDALNLEAVQAGNNITVTINAAGYAAGAETAPCVLNQPATSSWATLTITPIGAVTVSGAIVAGSTLIDLNGADNVTIDGLNASGNSMIISNTTASATSGTSTIRMQTDATGNTITNCTVLGSFSAAVATNGGNIYFGAGAVTTGNDNNTISNCNIGPAGANLPTKGVYGNGSTTNTTVYNSGNTITGCNIFDYFGAAVASAGIYITGGNTDYTITNNKLYQSATRTQTTGAIHAGIQLASANINNCTISGNTVGFANNTGTGTYEFVGVSSSSRFYPIYISSHGTVTATSIQGNTVKNIKISGLVSGTSTSSPFAGILVSSGLANIGNVTGNTIGSSSSPASIDYTSTGTSTGELYGIYFFPSASCNISNNVIGGIRGTNTSTGGHLIYGIRAFTSSTSPITNTFVNNTVGYSAAPIENNAATSTASRVIGLYSQSGASVLTGNTISNLNCVAPNVGTGSASSVLGIWSDNSSATTGNNISGNTIHSLSNTNATAAVWVTGMTYNGSTTAGTYNIQKNFVHSLNITSSSATATMNGIYIIGGIATYYNNMVRLGIDASGNSVGAGVAINGISEQVAGTDNIYFNSVYIGGSGVAGSTNTYAFISTITTNTRNFRDNIFYNARSNGAGTGKHYAVRVGGTAPNPAGLTINNNVYLANGAGGVFGFFNLLDVANLAAWKTAVGQDLNSFESNPQYLTPNGTASTVDLHINPSIPTNVEGNGFDVVTITEDYDSQTRSGLTPVDIGADAGNFTPGADITGPAIVYTLLSNTSSTSSRTLIATITDASGVDQSAGNKPRVYYKKSTDANDLASWKTTQVTTISVDSYTFNIDYSLLSPVVAGDVIQYFVIAQDLMGTPNVGINAASLNSPATSVNLAAGNFPASSPNSYIIVGAPLSGDYTIGVLAFNRASGKNITMERVVKKVIKEVFVADQTTDNVKSTDAKELASPYAGKGKMVMQEVEEVSFVPMENGREYTEPLYVKRSENPELPVDAGAGVYGTITAAIADLNLRGVSGAVRFLLLDATYPTETYPITVSSITGASVSNTVTLKPNTGVTSTVSGSSSAGPIFKINSSYFTIDGSNTVNGTTRDLTIENTSTTTPQVVRIGSIGTTPIVGSGVKNCTAINGVNTSSAIVLLDNAGSLGGYFNDITIQNNNVQKSYVGIYTFAIVSAGNGSGLAISSNSVNSTGANQIRNVGIYLQGIDGGTVSSNDIGNFETATSENDRGIWLATSTKNVVVEKNVIHDIIYTGTAGYGGKGVSVSTAAAASNISIQNNMIYNMAGDGDSYTTFGALYDPTGIVVYIAGTAGVNIYYNSIYLYGNTLNFSALSYSIGIALDDGATATVVNNSIQNNCGLLGATGVGAVAIALETSASQLTAVNKNNYYCNASSGINNIGKISTTDYPTLAGWNAAASDASLSGNPQYISTTNLHISLATNSINNNNGATGTGVTTDIDGNPRSATKPDIGADEFTGAYVLNLTVASEYCPTGLYTVKLYDASVAEVGSATNVAITDNATSLNLVYNGITDLTGGYFSIAGVNTLFSWSNLNTINPSDASSITYNMTTAQTQEFSSNLRFNGNNVWSIISGDVNQDETVDATDLAAVENDVVCTSPAGCNSGYPTDLNCDGDNVDASDLAIVENNQGVFVTYPPAANGINPDKSFKVTLPMK